MTYLSRQYYSYRLILMVRARVLAGLFAINAQFIAPLPETFTANAELFSQICLVHMLLILKHKSGEIIFQREASRNFSDLFRGIDNTSH